MCDLPIISVSQKPIDFGENICVGDVGASTHNTKRQTLIGMKAAKTRYVTMAEADFIYPKEYFDFVPERDDRIYCLRNIYILWFHKNKFFMKPNSNGALVANREFLIDLFEMYLGDSPMWYEKRGKCPEYSQDERINILMSLRDYEQFWTDIPAVTFKTGKGVSFRCPFYKNRTATELPHWGKAEDLHNEFF